MLIVDAFQSQKSNTDSQPRGNCIISAEVSNRSINSLPPRSQVQVRGTAVGHCDSIIGDLASRHLTHLGGDSGEGRHRRAGTGTSAPKNRPRILVSMHSASQGRYDVGLHPPLHLLQFSSAAGASFIPHFLAFKPPKNSIASNIVGCSPSPAPDIAYEDPCFRSLFALSPSR
jgi:hypothetical protein